MFPSRLKANPAVIFLLLVLLSILVRILTAEYVDIGGDNVWRWTSARDLYTGVGYAHWTHHNMRWSIMIPLWASLKLFGTNPGVYYVLPILTASVGTAFIYLIGRKLHGNSLGLAAALLVVVFPQMIQTGSQNWPSVYQFTFIAVSVWAILVWLENHKDGFLVLAACFFVLCWGARTSAVYYFPGLLLLIWLPSRSFRAVFLFGAVVGLGIGAEWLFFFLDTGNPFGRIGIIKTATKSVSTITTWDYLLHFLKLKKLRGLMPIFILTALASLVFLRDRDARLRAFAWFHLIFLFLLLYMVSGFDPIRLAQPVGSRYWCAVAPFGLLLLMMALFRLGERRRTSARVLIGVLFAAFIFFSVKKIPAHNNILQVAEDYAVLEPVFAGRQPLLLKWEPWRPNFIEAVLYDLFGAKRVRKANPNDVYLSMQRGIMRALGLFAPDTALFYEYDKDWLHQVDEFSYVYVPAGTALDAKPGAEIYFDRKGALAQTLPSE